VTNWPSSELQLDQKRHWWGDRRFSDVVTARMPPEGLRFAEIDQCPHTLKLGEVAYLRELKARVRGIKNPVIVAFARLEQDHALSRLAPELDPYTATGERLLSANSLLTVTLRTLLTRGWLQYDGEVWDTRIPQHQARWRGLADWALRLLTRDHRLLLAGALGRRVSSAVRFEGFDTRRDLVPVDRLGFVREFFWRKRPRVAFNAAFFLLEHDDYFSHHSALGEPYGLYVRDGSILRPPLYRRAALFQRVDGLWQIERLSMADVTITLAHGITLRPQESRGKGIPFALNPENGSEVAVYTRAWGLASRGEPLRVTPQDPDRLEFTIMDTRVVGRKRGGGLPIPQNGMVLSVFPSALPVATASDQELFRVTYGFAHPRHRGIRQAIQTGPELVRGGAPVVSEESLVDEEFWPTPRGATDLADVGVAPTDYPDDVDQTRAGRIGIGFDANGSLVVVAVPSTERGTQRAGLDSAGATLLELAGLMAQAGATDAINLDGGGSTQLFYYGGLTTTPGNRYGMAGVCFERMVPSVGVFE
jgi:hypothetical protein